MSTSPISPRPEDNRLRDQAEQIEAANAEVVAHNEKNSETPIPEELAALLQKNNDDIADIF